MAIKKETNTKVARTQSQVTRKTVTETVKTDAVVAPKAAKGGLTVTAFSIAGKEVGNVELPKEIFGAKVNKSLLAQAVRVYVNNQLGHWTNTKTRGEVTGSTKKIGSQKGGGRARHGSIMAPIFVGGGIALGPKSRKTVMDLPKKMRIGALIAALSDKASQAQVLGIEGLEKASGKTSEFASFLKVVEKRSVVIVDGSKAGMTARAVKNIPGLSYTTAEQLSLLDVLNNQSLVVTKEGLVKLEERLVNKQEVESSR